MALLKRDPERPAAPVAASWKRIEAWLKVRCKPMLAALRPGVTDAKVKRLEKSGGFPLPKDVRESYMIHDSYDGRAAKGENGESIGLFFYNLPLVDRYESVFTSWQTLTGFCRDHPERQEDPSLKYDWFHWKPEGFIRRASMLPGWMPLAHDGGGNYLGVDLNPGPKGTVGQVINFGRDEDVMYVLARSWGQFLEDVADELEAGNLYLKDDEDIWDLWLRAPEVKPFFNGYRVWSEAKIGIRIRFRSASGGKGRKTR